MTLMLRMLTLIFLVILLGSCTKSETGSIILCGGPSAPSCVFTTLEQFKTSHNLCSTGASVKEFKWDGRAVFVFDEGICIADGQSAVLDANCKVLGYLGGIAGNSKIEGKEWAGAVYVQTIWSN